MRCLFHVCALAGGVLAEDGLEGLPRCENVRCVIDFAGEIWGMGHKQEAVTWLRYSLQTKYPDDPAILNYVAMMLEEVEGKEAAFKIHKRVLELDDGRMAAAYEHGRLAGELGDPITARRSFEQMLEKLATGRGVVGDKGMFTALPHHHLGVLDAKAGATASAMRHFRQAFDSDPIGIYLAAHNLQIMGATDEYHADGSIVDLSIANSVEMNVKHPVWTNTTARCAVCDGTTVRAGAFFVEIGTSDFDTLAHRFFAEGFWTGVSVEPIASYLERLPTRPGFTKVNAVVSDVDGFQELFMVPEETIKALGLPEMAKGLSSLIQDHRDVVSNPRLKEHFRPV